MEKAEEVELIAQMRTSIQNLGGVSDQSYGDATLMRFLAVKSMDPEKAAKKFVEWQKWRAEFVPLGFIPESEVTGQLAERKIYLGGPTKGGHPLLMIKGCNHSPSKNMLPLKKFVVHLMDKTIASAHKGTEIGNEKIVGLMDLHQVSFRNVDYHGFKDSFHFLQAYYPGRVEKFYIINLPRFFRSIWKILSPFVGKALLQKIVMVTNEEEMKSCIEQIGEEALPECYGGKAKLVALQEFVITTE